MGIQSITGSLSRQSKIGNFDLATSIETVSRRDISMDDLKGMEVFEAQGGLEDHVVLFGNW